MTKHTTPTMRRFQNPSPLSERRSSTGLFHRWTGEFRERKLEEEYRRTDFHSQRANARLLLMLMAGTLSGIMALDLAFSPLQAQQWVGLALRGLYMVISILVVLRVSTLSDFTTLSRTVTAYELLSICTWFYLAGTGAAAYGLYPVGIGVIALTLMCFLIPNRWVHAVALSAFAFLLAALICGPRLGEITLHEGLVSFLFTGGIGATIAIISRRQGIECRRQHMDHLRLLHMSLTDPLTGISNRGRFNEALQSWANCAEQYAMPLSLVLFDFDDFKRVNDVYGHLIGDQVILQTVNLVDDAIRRRDVFARWGGEEFTLLFPDTRLEEALDIVERLRHTIERHAYGKCGHVTASFGVVQYRSGEGVDAFMDRADRMLYRAKSDGKNCIRSIS